MSQYAVNPAALPSLSPKLIDSAIVRLYGVEFDRDMPSLFGGLFRAEGA